MSDLVKAYGFCDAGCRRRVPTYDEFEKSAGIVAVKQTGNSNNKYEIFDNVDYRLFFTDGQKPIKVFVTVELDNGGGMLDVLVDERGVAQYTSYEYVNVRVNTLRGGGLKITRAIRYEFHNNRNDVLVSGAVDVQSDVASNLEIKGMYLEFEGDVYRLNPNGTIKAENGESAYEIAVRHGFNGTEAEWLASLGIGNIYRGAVKSGGYYEDNGEWITNNSYKCAVLPVNAIRNGDLIRYSPEFAYYNGQFRFDAITENGTWIKKIYQGFDTSFVVDVGVSDSFYIAIRMQANVDVTNLFVMIERHLNFYGKTINCLGDSFTEPSNAWHKFLEKRMGLKCNNYGKGSSRITIDSDNIKSFLNRYQDMDATADATIIFGGINDSRSMYVDGVNPTIDLGSMDSPLDNTSFYGGLRLLIESIKNYMPGKKIIGVIPPDFQQNDGYTTTLPLVQTACREIYEHYGIPYADLKKECQEMYIDNYNFMTYRQGALNDYHPSEVGHNAISEIIQCVIEKVLKA